MGTLIGFLLGLAGFAQTLQFEVASVKPNAPGQFSRSNITTDPGRLRADNVDIKLLIGYAYDVSPLVITGDLPATRFDVERQSRRRPHPC